MIVWQKTCFELLARVCSLASVNEVDPMQERKFSRKRPIVANRRTRRSDYPSRQDAPSVERLAVTIAETQQMLGIGRTKVYALLGDGKIAARKIGRRTVVSVESIRHFLANLPAAEIAAQSRAS
jgi:hypothetical protein